MKPQRILIFGLLALSLTLSACNPIEVGLETPASAPTATPTPASVPTAPPVTVPADAVPFDIAAAGLALSLPAGWNIAGPIAAQGYSLYLLGPEAGSSGGPDASQIIVADADQLTIEQFAEQQCSICPVQTVEDTTLNGQPARRLVIGGGSAPEFVWHFLTANGRLIGLSIRPRDGQTYDWVLTTVTLTTASGGQQTYSNPNYGFALDVPAGWIVDTPPSAPGYIETVAYLYSQAPQAQPGQGSEGVFAGLKIDVTVVNELTSKTLDQLASDYIANLSEGAGNAQVTSDVRLTLPSGLSAARIQSVSGFGEGVVLIAVVHGRTVMLGGYGTELNRFDEVAQTLRETGLPVGQPLSFTCSVAFANESRLYCLGEGGTPIPIADHTGQGSLFSPEISFDGRWVAYLLTKPDATSELWAVDVGGLTGNDGLNLPRRMLVNADPIASGNPGVLNSPDRYEWQAAAHVIYFNTRYIPAGGIQGPGEYTNNDLWSVNVDSGAVANVLSRNTVGQFDLSPDGQYVAIANPQSLAVARSDGSGFQLLLEFPLVMTYSEYTYKPVTVWGPASDEFFTLIPSADPFAADAAGTIYRMNVFTGAQALGTVRGNFLFNVALEWDGARLAYLTYDQAGNSGALHLVNADGGGDTIVAQFPTGLSFNSLGWSPISAVYAYSLVMQGGNYLVTGGGSPQEFGSGTQASELRWVGPNSFYFTAVSDTGWGIYFHAVGQESQPIVTGYGNPIHFDAR